MMVWGLNLFIYVIFYDITSFLRFSLIFLNIQIRYMKFVYWIKG